MTDAAHPKSKTQVRSPLPTVTARWEEAAIRSRAMEELGTKTFQRNQKVRVLRRCCVDVASPRFPRDARGCGERSYVRRWLAFFARRLGQSEAWMFTSSGDV